MIKDKLLINDDKTDFNLVDTRQQRDKARIDTLLIGVSVVTASNVARKLGSWFDCHMSTNTQVNKIFKAALCYLYNIERIRKYLSEDSTKILILSLLNHCNALVYGLPNAYLCKLQGVRNSAARLVFRAPNASFAIHFHFYLNCTGYLLSFQ